MDKAYAHDQAVLEARLVLKGDYVVLDSETTGLINPEVCQLAYVVSNYKTFCTLVKPVASIEPGATAVHGITNEMVREAKPIDAYWEQIGSLRISQMLIGYNLSYDIKALSRSLRLKNIVFEPPKGDIFDVMLCYAAFRGDINPAYGTFKWHKLGEALAQCNLTFDGVAHNALTDVRATLDLLRYIAGQETTWEIALDTADTLCSRFGESGSDEVVAYNRACNGVTYRRGM